MDTLQMKAAHTEQLCDPDPRILTWRRLEDMRLKKLGLPVKYSRYFPRTKETKTYGREDSFDLSGSTEGLARAVKTANETNDNRQGGISGSKSSREGKAFSKANSLAPFTTHGKPTCGYFFTDVTNNRKRKFGIPPSDLVKWRNFSAN